MNDTYRTARLALVLLSGGMVGAGLMFTGVGCHGDGKIGTGAREVHGPAVASVYRQVDFDRALHGCVSGPAAEADDCASCHHAEPDAANKACRQCHSRDEGRFSKKFGAFVPKLKEAMHDPDGGCRNCHDETTEDDLWDCEQCHTGLKG